VPQYFKNRTWGVEIIDNSRVAGVTKPTLTVNQYTTVDFLTGGVAFFRAFDRPGVTGYGWMAPGELVDDNVAICEAGGLPGRQQAANANGINNGCTIRIKRLPWPCRLDGRLPERPERQRAAAGGGRRDRSVAIVLLDPEAMAPRATPAASATTPTSGSMWSAPACAMVRRAAAPELGAAARGNAVRRPWFGVLQLL
jgi:hypothetical protein